MGFPTKGFKGKIDNKGIPDFLSQLDFSLSQEDRIKLVEDILYTQECNNDTVKDKFLDKYYETYFDEKFNSNPNQKDYLSHDNNVCNSLEAMANYILFADDTEKVKKTKYNFYTVEQLKKICKHEVSLQELVEKTYKDVKDENIINFIKNSVTNHKKEIKQYISKQDIKDIEAIRDYEKYKSKLYKKLVELRNDKTDKKLQKFILNILKDIKSDQIYCKDTLKGVIYFKSPLNDSTDIDYEQFDFLDFKHVKELLGCNNTNVLTDLGCLGQYLNQIIEDLNLSDDERLVLDLYHSHNVNQEDIAIELGFSQQYVSKIINKITNKVIKAYFKLLEDWYYTEVCKGTYKQCSKCGEIKLISRFDKDKNGCNLGLKGVCKSCR